jgi:hypothetical protein
MMDNRDDSWDNFLRLAEPTSVIPWPYKDIKAEIPAAAAAHNKETTSEK